MKKNTTHQRIYTYFFFLLLCIPACIHKRQIDKQILYIKPIKESLNNPKKAPPVTIWVHGTLMFYKPFYYNIFGSQSCLVPTTFLPYNHRLRLIADAMVKEDPESFSSEEFYAFCWSGKLQALERKKAAQKLYEDLIFLIENYQKKYGCYPHIRIIAHSHGGNVVLYMAKIKSDPLKPLIIQSVVFLACPVQETTRNLINAPLFQKVYSLYSSFDFIQIIAPQLCRKKDATIPKKKRPYKKPHFSSRIFPDCPHIIQAKIKINHYPIAHTSFSSTYFAALLPSILKKLDSWPENNKNKASIYKLLCIYT